MMLMLRPEWRQESKSVLYFCENSIQHALRYFVVVHNELHREMISPVSELLCLTNSPAKLKCILSTNSVLDIEQLTSVVICAVAVVLIPSEGIHFRCQ